MQVRVHHARKWCAARATVNRVRRSLAAARPRCGHVGTRVASCWGAASTGVKRRATQMTVSRAPAPVDSPASAELPAGSSPVPRQLGTVTRYKYLLLFYYTDVIFEISFLDKLLCHFFSLALAYSFSLGHYNTSGASEIIFECPADFNSRATGPKIRVPTGCFSLSSNTAALSSNRI